MNALLLGILLLMNMIQTPPDPGSIEIIVSGISSNEGVIQVIIFDQSKGWPDTTDDGFQSFSIPIKNGVAKKMLANIPAGEYAITLFHDHDRDGKIRKNKVGYPLDSFGFSNNPTLIFGAPSFRKCKKTVTSNKGTRFEIKLR